MAWEPMKNLIFSTTSGKTLRHSGISGKMTVRLGGYFVGLVQESPRGILGFPVLRALLQVGYQWSPPSLKIHIVLILNGHAPRISIISQENPGKSHLRSKGNHS